MRGFNAAVVGLLGSALYNPVWITSVRTAGDFEITLAEFVLLTVWRLRRWSWSLSARLGGIVFAFAHG